MPMPDVRAKLRRLADPSRPFNEQVELDRTGDVQVTVDGWGYWNVWMTTVSWLDPNRDADVVLHPGEALAVAARLTAAATVCWAKVTVDRLTGRYPLVRNDKGNRRG